MIHKGLEQWKGKVAVVTGASSGIGASIAEKLVKLGVKVAGLARRKERLDELAKKLIGKDGKLFSVQADLTKESDILGAFKWIRDNLGPVHILINSAGIARNTTLVDGDTQMWKEVLDTNVLGLCIATREAVKDMRLNNVDGHIVNLNSLAGHRITSSLTHNIYPASKYAVTALTETLRQNLVALGTKIKITSISPGPTMTEFLEASGGAPPPVTVDMLQPEDIADAILFTLSTPPNVQVSEVTVRPRGYLS